MELKGFHQVPTLLRKATPEECLKYSTRYDDKELVLGLSIAEKLDNLSVNLHEEISFYSPFILSMEELADRYYEDGLIAIGEHNVGYYMRYATAYEESRVIIHNLYALIPPVLV